MEADEYRPPNNDLGNYLRARREQVQPEDVGLVAGPRRRVRGLRREELATLAGISGPYYLRLEQGRDKNPSPRIVTSLARALQLDTTATEYLHRLASGTHRKDSDLDSVAYGVDGLIDQLPLPAVIINRYQDVLAANAIARALSPAYTPGENISRWLLAETAACDFYLNWEYAVAGAVSALRELAGSDPGDPRLHSLLTEFFDLSPLFRQLWERADVGYPRDISHVRHPIVGELELRRHWLSIPQSGGQFVVILQPEPSSASEQAVRRLVSD